MYALQDSAVRAQRGYMSNTVIDRWIIGGLMMAVSVILWWLLLDTRSNVATSSIIININSSRLSSLESRTDNLERTVWEIKEELRQHRAVVERQK